jgi:hypothetical protein
MAYNIGDAVPIYYLIADPATVVCTVTDPAGGTTNPVLTEGPGPGPGGGPEDTTLYTGAFQATMAGAWLVRFVATGAITDSEDQQIIVEPAAAPDLYATVNELRLSIGDTSYRADTGQLTAALRAASRAVDGWCQRRGRKFWLDPAATTRRYAPTEAGCVWVEDIGSTAGLTVKTDSDGDGVFETTWTTPADYQLEPLNASANGAYAWTRIVAVGSLSFPLLSTAGGAQRATVQVTARHGWSQIPDPVREAALLKAVRLYRRKDVPFGNEFGGGDFGPIRITREDSDVVALLSPYTAALGFG